jgi:hypothetical protein
LLDSVLKTVAEQAHTYKKKNSARGDHFVNRVVA